MSSLQQAETYPSVPKDRSESANGSGSFADGSCGTVPTERVQAAYQAMTTALLHWHFTGDFIAAADYVIARRKWETAVLDSTKGDQQ